jgi:F420-dependent hydroxymycolic acid dehydrogenase
MAAKRSEGDVLITDPKTWKAHRAAFEAGASAAGRDPDHLPVLIELYVVVGDSRNAEAAAQLWHFGPKAWKPYCNIPDPQTIERRAQAEVPPEEVYQEWPVSPEVHVQTILQLFNNGTTHVSIHSGHKTSGRSSTSMDGTSCPACASS